MKFGKACMLAAALLTGLAAPSLAQETVAGTWELLVQTPQGTNPITLEVMVDGTKATGSLTSQLGTMPISGTATADSIEMSGTLEVQGMSLLLGVNGKLQSGDLNGAMRFGDFGEGPFVGKRAAAKAAVAPPAASATPAAPAAAVDPNSVGGKWNVTLTIPGMGDVPLTANLTQTGEAVTGVVSSLMGEVELKGTFIGSALKMEFTAETPQGPMPVTMTGELKDQALSGKVVMVGLGEADWKAVRGQ